MEDLDACPLCMETLDITDKAVQYCQCGYQMCLWCWNQIMDNARKDNLPGRCPNCRTVYDSAKIKMDTIDPSELEEVKRRNKNDKKKGGAASKNKKDLANVRVLQRNLVYAVGLALEICQEDVLKDVEYFGQFGKVIKISVNRTSPHSTAKNGTGSAYITFRRADDALKCITTLDGQLLCGRPLRLCFGTTKYCNAFLKGIACNNPDCLYLHDIADEEISFTKEEMLTLGPAKFAIVGQATPGKRPVNGQIAVGGAAMGEPSQLPGTASIPIPIAPNPAVGGQDGIPCPSPSPPSLLSTSGNMRGTWASAVAAGAAATAPPPPPIGVNDMDWPELASTMSTEVEDLKEKNLPTREPSLGLPLGNGTMAEQLARTNAQQNGQASGTTALDPPASKRMTPLTSAGKVRNLNKVTSRTSLSSAQTGTEAQVKDIQAKTEEATTAIADAKAMAVGDELTAATATSTVSTSKDRQKDQQAEKQRGQQKTEPCTVPVPELNASSTDTAALCQSDGLSLSNTASIAAPTTETAYTASDVGASTNGKGTASSDVQAAEPAASSSTAMQTRDKPNLVQVHGFADPVVQSVKPPKKGPPPGFERLAGFMVERAPGVKTLPPPGFAPVSAQPAIPVEASQPAKPRKAGPPPGFENVVPSRPSVPEATAGETPTEPSTFPSSVPPVTEAQLSADSAFKHEPITKADSGLEPLSGSPFHTASLLTPVGSSVGILGVSDIWSTNPPTSAGSAGTLETLANVSSTLSQQSVGPRQGSRTRSRFQFATTSETPSSSTLRELQSGAAPGPNLAPIPTLKPVDAPDTSSFFRTHFPGVNVHFGSQAGVPAAAVSGSLQVPANPHIQLPSPLRAAFGALQQPQPSAPNSLNHIRPNLFNSNGVAVPPMGHMKDAPGPFAQQPQQLGNMLLQQLQNSAAKQQHMPQHMGMQLDALCDPSQSVSQSPSQFFDPAIMLAQTAGGFGGPPAHLQSRPAPFVQQQPPAMGNVSQMNNFSAYVRPNAPVSNVVGNGAVGLHAAFGLNYASHNPLPMTDQYGHRVHAHNAVLGGLQEYAHRVELANNYSIDPGNRNGTTMHGGHEAGLAARNMQLLQQQLDSAQREERIYEGKFLEAQERYHNISI